MLFSHFPPLMTIYVLAKGYQLFNDFLMVFEFVQYDIIFLSVEDESVYRRTIWLRPAKDFWGIWLQLRSTFLDWHSAWMCMRYDFNVIKAPKKETSTKLLQLLVILRALQLFKEETSETFKIWEVVWLPTLQTSGSL